MKKSVLMFGILGLMLALSPAALAQSNKEKIRIFWEQVYALGKLEMLPDLFSADAIHHEPIAPGGEWPRGPEGVKVPIGIFRTAFPDLSVKVVAQYEQGDTVVTQWVATGTQTGPLNNIPPSGKKVVVTGMNITRIQNGKAVEDWHNWDFYGLLVQIGAIPAPGK